MAAEARFPVLLKPQTQILFESHVKGSQVERASELLPRYREFLERNHYGRKLLEYDAKANRPMVQAFHTEAAQNIFSLSGFVDRTGELFVARGAMKVLQRPRKLGIGLCFEDVPVEPELAEKVRALCKKLGYHGTFEVEFIRAGGKRLLIDFNPRFYSQMGFDIARGMPLPLLVYEAALGDAARWTLEARRARRWKGPGPPGLLPPVILEFRSPSQGLSGRLQRGGDPPLAAAGATRAAVTGRSHGAMLDREDLASLFDSCAAVLESARHPRSFVRQNVLNQ